MLHWRIVFEGVIYHKKTSTAGVIFLSVLEEIALEHVIVVDECLLVVLSSESNVDCISTQIGLVVLKCVLQHHHHWLVVHIVPLLHTSPVSVVGTVLVDQVCGLKPVSVLCRVLEKWLIDRNGATKHSNVAFEAVVDDRYRPLWFSNVNC